MVTVLRMTQIINMITSAEVWEEEDHQKERKKNERNLFSADHHHKFQEEVIQSRDRMSTESVLIKSYQSSNIEKEEQHRNSLTQQQQRSVTTFDTQSADEKSRRHESDKQTTVLWFRSLDESRQEGNFLLQENNKSNCSSFLNQISFLKEKKRSVATLLAVDQKEKRLVLQENQEKEKEGWEDDEAKRGMKGKQALLLFQDSLSLSPPQSISSSFIFVLGFCVNRLQNEWRNQKKEKERLLQEKMCWKKHEKYCRRKRDLKPNTETWKAMGVKREFTPSLFILPTKSSNMKMKLEDKSLKKKRQYKTRNEEDFTSRRRWKIIIFWWWIDRQE